MPQTLGFFLFQAGAPLWLVNSVTFGFGATLINAGVQVALSYGVKLATDLLFGSGQSGNQNLQIVVSQADPPRFRSYGRVKVGGDKVFEAWRDGALHRVIYIGEGPIAAIEEIWLDDRLCLFDGDGNATTAPYVGVVHAEWRLGAADDTPYASLLAAFPELDESFLGRGCASLYVTIKRVADADYLDTFPNGYDTLLRTVQRGAMVFDPRDAMQSLDDASTWTWSENAALILFDMLYHRDGVRAPRGTMSDAALAALAAEADVADETVALKAGGSEARWRIGYSYSLDQSAGTRASHLERMMAAVDARMVLADGVLLPRTGHWSDPAVVIGPASVRSIDELGRGRATGAANLIQAKFTSPVDDYQARDARPWQDDADIARRGPKPATLDLTAAPSHGQARRVMKVALARANPEWRGSLGCMLDMLQAIGEPLLGLSLPEFSIHAAVEPGDEISYIAGGDNGEIVGVQVPFTALAKEARAWDPASEEGDPLPLPDAIEVDNTLDPPADFDVDIGQVAVGGGVSVAIAVATFTPPTDPALHVEVRYERTGGLDSWTPLGVLDGQGAAESGPLEDGAEYEFQARTVSQTGRVSAWTASVTRTALADPTAPGAVTGLSATGGAGTITLSWMAPNSGNFVKADIYRNSVNSFAGATPAGVLYGAANAAQSVTLTGVSPAGAWYVFVAAANASNIESAPASASATVT